MFIYLKFEHSENILIYPLEDCLILKFDISRKNKEEQPANIFPTEFMSFALIFDKSKEVNDEHL